MCDTCPRHTHKTGCQCVGCTDPTFREKVIARWMSDHEPWEETTFEAMSSQLEQSQKFWRQQHKKLNDITSKTVDIAASMKGPTVSSQMDAIKRLDAQEAYLQKMLQQQVGLIQSDGYWKKAFDDERKRNEDLQKTLQTTIALAKEMEKKLNFYRDAEPRRSSLTVTDIMQAADTYGYHVLKKQEWIELVEHMCPPACRCWPEGKNVTVKCAICSWDVVGTVYKRGDDEVCRKCYLDLDPDRLNPPLYQRHKKAFSWGAPAAVAISSGFAAWVIPDSNLLADNLAVLTSLIGCIWFLSRGAVFYVRGK